MSLTHRGIVTQKVVEALVDNGLDVHEEPHRMTATLSDMGADSLSIIEVLMTIEESIGVAIPFEVEYRLHPRTTLQELVDIIEPIVPQRITERIAKGVI